MSGRDSQSIVDKPQGLLGAVLGNPQLRRQFGKMSADEKTIELSSPDGEDFSNPNWKAGQVDSSQFETLELPAEELPTVKRPVDKGFVPRRSVVTLGQENSDTADYRIVGRLGSGGTGVVYQSHQRAIDREVAIKVLRDELSYNALSRERFLTEARVIGGLDHPNVIAIHEVCTDDNGGLFYSMKRVDGTSWDGRIGDLSLPENVEVLLRVADAIDYAHSRGLIHRDIKPENVMLGRFGEVLMADWGLAISHGSIESTQGIPHSIGGTPAYMAPELARGAHSAIGYQTDVYLLGAILFQILTGHPPHQGSSLLACIHAAAQNDIRETDIEGELMDIAMKAMKTDPADRFESVEAFSDAIKHQQQHDQSERLVRRACQRLAGASDANQYEDFRVADALLMEAIDVWPENARAHQTQKKLRLRFAEAATARNDLDLALSIYDAAGEAECDAAKQVRADRDQRAASHQRISHLSALFTHSPEAGLLIQMSTGKVVEANEMFGHLFGYSADEVVGRPIEDLNLWACPRRRNELVVVLKRSGAIDNFEGTFFHTSGEIIDVLISGRVVEVQGEPMVVTTIRDISLRKKAEKELRQSQQRLRDVQRLAGLATWSYDVSTEEVTWSEETFSLIGRSVTEGVPTKEEFFEIIHPDDRGKLQQAITTALDSGAAYELPVRQIRPGGDLKSLLVRGQPIFDESGKAIEIYGVLIPQRCD